MGESVVDEGHFQCKAFRGKSLVLKIGQKLFKKSRRLFMASMKTDNGPGAFRDVNDLPFDRIILFQNDKNKIIRFKAMCL